MSSTNHLEVVMTRHSAAHRAIRHLVDLWSEIDYAQRRMFEIQTGIPITDHRKRRPDPLGGPRQF